MSGAILYLAIVAIWAVVLVPRWLHPRSALQPHVTDGQEEAGQQDETAQDTDEAPLGAPSSEGTAGHGAGLQRGTSPRRERRRTPRAPLPAAQRRALIMRARRRMLGTIVVMVAGAAGLMMAHIAPPWLIVPPSVMLAGFLVLLREAAHIDAERARRRALAARASGRGAPEVTGADPRTADPRPAADRRGAAGQPGYRPERAPQPQARPGQERPAAQIIDLSAHLDGQFYDQYSDAVERAVGD